MMYRISNEHERYATIRAMDMLARQTNNETALEMWFSQGISDGDIDLETPDEMLADYIDDDKFRDVLDTFLCVMSESYKQGGLSVDGVSSELG
jgi:hypothetical protein